MGGKDGGGIWSNSTVSKRMSEISNNQLEQFIPRFQGSPKPVVQFKTPIFFFHVKYNYKGNTPENSLFGPT